MIFLDYAHSLVMLFIYKSHSEGLLIEVMERTTC